MLYKRTWQKQRTNLKKYGLIAVVLLLFFRTAVLPPAAPLSALPVPAHISETTYSGPLTLSSVNVSVLGAQTIDPVDFVREINKEREKVGAPQLRMSTTLMDAATMRAKVILKYQNFSHQDPHEGIELGTVLPKLNYHFVYASENIGMGGTSASDFVNGFMHSTSHRENLLNPKLTETGVAIMDGPYHQYYVNIAVQMFATPGGQDEYLGYSTAEQTRYRQAYELVARKLNPVRRYIQQFLKNPDYTNERIVKYLRQKQILETVLARMRKNEPLVNPDVSLILEYNTLL